MNKAHACARYMIQRMVRTQLKSAQKRVDILEELHQLVQMPIDKDTQLLHKSSETALQLIESNANALSTSTDMHYKELLAVAKLNCDVHSL